MVCASEGDLCYHLYNAARPMTDPKNTEDQELSLDQLKDTAGGIGANSGPGGTSYPKDNVAGSAGPGGDDV